MIFKNSVLGRGNTILLKLRDKFFPSIVLRVDSGDGVVPFHKWNDVASDLWLYGEYEESDRAILRKNLPKFNCFVDIGSNLGIYSLLASRTMQAGAVVAFEPSPLEFEKLKTTIEWNSLGNVNCECMAISDHEGEVQFSESLDGLGVLNKIGAPAKPQNRNRQIAVKCMRLDAYFSTSVLRPDFIKIDVERHELAVLSGARNIIQQHRPVFMIEMMWSNGDEASGPEAIWDFLSAQNYQWFGLTEHGQSVDKIFEKPLTRDDLAHRRSVIKNHAYPSRNMYAVPSEKTALMKA